VRELAAQILGRNVRLGKPSALTGVPDSMCGPSCAAVAGLLHFAVGDGQTMHDINFDEERIPGWFGRFVKFLKDRL